jgi:hypothetical protein
MGIGKAVTFTNRSRVSILIVRKSELEFEMEGVDLSFMRVSRDDDGNILMFDPSGGPYTTCEAGNSPGTDLGCYDEDWKYLVVTEIKFNHPDTGKIMLTCKYTKPIEWERIK